MHNNIYISGSVDTLASNTLWKIDILLKNEDSTNNIFKKQNINFTSSVSAIATGDWTKNANIGELLRATNGNGNSGSLSARVINTLFPSPSILSGSVYLPCNLYNPTIQKFIKGHSYTLYADVKTDNTFDISASLGVRNVLATHTNHMITTSWNTVSSSFTYTGETEYRDLEMKFISQGIGATKYVWMDNFKVHDNDAVENTYDVKIIDFGDFEVGTEGKDVNSALEISHTFSIRPDIKNFYAIATEILDKIYNYGAVVKYWKSTDSGANYTLHWVGVTDGSEISVNIPQKTIEFSIKSILASNKNYENVRNPFGYSIVDEDRGSTFVPIVDFLMSASNYIDDDFGSMNFYDTVRSTCTLKGLDQNNRYATVSGYKNTDEEPLCYLAFDSWRFFRANNSTFWANTFGELVDQLAFATNSRITTWFNGIILYEPIYYTPLKTVVDLDLSDCIDLEIGIQDQTYTGIQTIVKTAYFNNWALTEATPKYFTVPDGAVITDVAGNVKDNAMQKTLVFYADFWDTSNAETFSMDWLTVCGGVNGVIHNGWPGSYVAPTSWSVLYGTDNSYENQSYINCHQKFLLNGVFQGRTYIRTTVKGTDWSPDYYYRTENKKVYEIRKWTINYVDNLTELYLLEM